MDQLGLVTSLQVPEDGGVIEISQVDHVLAFFKLESRTVQFCAISNSDKMRDLGRIDSANLASLQCEPANISVLFNPFFLHLLLVSNSDNHLDREVSAFHSEVSDVARLKKTLLVSMGLGVHDPDGFFRIVDLGLVGLFHVQGGP